MSLVDIEDGIPKNAPTTLDILTPSLSGRYVQNQIPKYKLADAEMSPNHAYGLIHEEISNEIPAVMNLSSYVTTWMEPEAGKLIQETQNKNVIDLHQYPVMNQIHSRCICIIADLLHASRSAYGTSTAGSSESCLLAGLALKMAWQQRMTSSTPTTTTATKSHTDIRPNLVISSSGHFIWKRFCHWFDIEYRQVPAEKHETHVSPTSYTSYIDQGTIGVVMILGTTLTGQYEPIRAVADQLSQLESDKGLKVPIHIDAAIGGFFVPFVDHHIQYDFRIDQVVSINLSGHKFGLTYPGIGWLIFRSEQCCPADLRYRLDYPDIESHHYLSINLSRSAAPIIAQYYNFIRLGRQGYTRIMLGIRSVAQYLYDTLNKHCSDIFRQLNDPASGLPVLVLTSAEGSDIKITTLSRMLALRGWTVPTYEVPYADNHIDVIRVVVREGFSRDQAELLFNTIMESIHEIREEPTAKKGRGTRKRKIAHEPEQHARIKHSIC